MAIVVLDILVVTARSEVEAFARRMFRLVDLAQIYIAADVLLVMFARRASASLKYRARLHQRPTGLLPSHSVPRRLALFHFAEHARPLRDVRRV
jgi:hypothetical protein